MEYLDSIWGKPQVNGQFYLNEGDILDSRWKGGIFIDVHISGGSLTGSFFEDCTFKNTTFENVYMDDVDFNRCHFENFKIINCSREGMEMRECTGSPPML
ncbi:MAG: pentapeptide repeat-containing protein, partial [Patescibacteria group bacterium]